ncbi:MAG: hypothetical protein AAFY65_20115 [Pseudomonadota bacterium]
MKCLDRPSETAAATVKKDLPFGTRTERGALRLERDTAEHRKFHAHFEDLLN